MFHIFLFNNPYGSITCVLFAQAALMNVITKMHRIIIFNAKYRERNADKEHLRKISFMVHRI